MWAVVELNIEGKKNDGMIIGMRMKKYFSCVFIFIIAVCMIFSENLIQIDTSIFDTLQRPLAHQLQTNAKRISRKSWEYHMASIGWWDIYLASGKKMGNGIYDISIMDNSDFTVRELHGTRTENDKMVIIVELIFSSSNNSVLQNLRNEFVALATSWYGKGTRNGDYTYDWIGETICYTAYPIQHHEDGNYLFTIGSLDFIHSNIN